MATTHYLEALDFQKEIVKIHTIFGGRNPHPNWVVGGMPCSINVDDAGAVGAINMTWLNMVSDIIDQSIAFTDQVYLPDLNAIAIVLQGLGLSVVDCPARTSCRTANSRRIANNYTNDSLMLPNGAILNGDLSTVYDVDVRDPEQIQEFVSHSWYQYSDERWPASLGRRDGAEV